MSGRRDRGAQRPDERAPSRRGESDRPRKSAEPSTLAQLRDDEAGALQIGVTDQAMVRLIVSTRAGVFDLDFEPDEADDIAAELVAAAERAKRLG